MIAIRYTKISRGIDNPNQVWAQYHLHPDGKVPQQVRICLVSLLRQADVRLGTASPYPSSATDAGVSFYIPGAPDPPVSYGYDDCIEGVFQMAVVGLRHQPPALPRRSALVRDRTWNGAELATRTGGPPTMDPSDLTFPPP